MGCFGLIEKKRRAEGVLTLILIGLDVILIVASYRFGYYRGLGARKDTEQQDEPTHI